MAEDKEKSGKVVAVAVPWRRLMICSSTERNASRAKTEKQPIFKGQKSLFGVND